MAIGTAFVQNESGNVGTPFHVVVDATGGGSDDYVQVMKLAVQTAGLSDLAPGDATNGLSVQQPRITAATATLSSVTASASSVALLASNTSRKYATVINDSTSAILYLAFAATATTSAYTAKVLAGGEWYMGSVVYTGAISGIWSAAVGAARITELT